MKENTYINNVILSITIFFLIGILIITFLHLDKLI